MTIQVISACQKDYSFQDTTGGGGGTTGNNCILSSFVEADPQTGKGDYAYLSAFDAAQKVIRIDGVDSTTNTVDETYHISYPSGRVQLDANTYFVVGANGKVSEYHENQSPAGTPGIKTRIRYTYNASGQMIQRTWEYDTIPAVTIMQNVCTYTGGNLTKEEVDLSTGLTILKVADIFYEYDLTRSVKNFLVIHAAAPELFVFQSAIDAGATAVNVPVKITSQSVDSAGVPQTRVTNLVNYVIDANNYVKSFQLTGDDFDYLALSAGYKYIMKYHCK